MATATVRFLKRNGPRREWGTGSINLRAKKDAKGNPVPAKLADYQGALTPWYRYLYRSPKDGAGKLLLATTRQHAADLARDWERAREEERARPVVKLEAGTFGKLAADFLRWKRSQVPAGSVSLRTVAWYQERLDQHVLPILETKPAATVTPADISDVLTQANLGPRSTNALVTLLGGIFDYAIENDVLAKSPVRPKLHRQKEKETDRLRRKALQEAMPTETQVRAFMDAGLAREDGTSAGAALALGIETGLRRDELEHLRREDVTLTDTLADLRVATDFSCGCRKCRANGGRHRTKNRHARYVPLTKRAEKIVRGQLAMLERDATPGPWLFPVLRHMPYGRVGAGSQLNDAHLADAMTALADAAGIRLPDGCLIHFCRHVALSQWEVAGLTQGQRDLASGHDAAGVRAGYSHGDRQALFTAFRAAL